MILPELTENSHRFVRLPEYASVEVLENLVSSFDIRNIESTDRCKFIQSNIEGSILDIKKDYNSFKEQCSEAANYCRNVEDRTLFYGCNNIMNSCNKIQQRISTILSKLKDSALNLDDKCN